MKKYSILLCILCVFLCYPVVSVYTSEKKQSDSCKTVVEECHIDSIDSYFQTKEAYAMGWNVFGRLVFQDTEKAFNQAMLDFEKSCQFLETELSLGTVEYHWQDYVQQRAWNPQCAEELQQEMNLLFQFLNVYKNSFDMFY